ncbi:MAG TPA: hypothetical protein PK995_05120 [Bacteroidia bacterium]|nr:hypothetical protein [Bacteroidia bacterium]
MSFFLLSVRSQDSVQNTQKIKWGATYNVHNGLFYAHAVGVVANFRDKHQLELNGLMLPEVNPFKDKNHFGASLNYIFLPNKADKTFNLIFTSSLYYLNDSYAVNYAIWNNSNISRVEYNINAFALLLGFGFDIKITKRIHIPLSLSNFIVAYSVETAKKIDINNKVVSKNSSSEFIYLEPEDFLVNDLLLRVGVVYYFGR